MTLFATLPGGPDGGLGSLRQALGELLQQLQPFAVQRAQRPALAALGGQRQPVRQQDGEEVEMELPSARQCPELTAQLSQIVGPWGFIGA